ncbi:hypothetical protein [Streptomyces cuspidosporus]|uniref:Uncharacterized protein n=1 Tax=Streptomyces cuspidosporus TaxID=66882 RepID=A0ABP5TR56_9ACTN
MTAPIEELLSRALLLEEPLVPRDIVPCVEADTPASLDGVPLWSERASLSRHRASHAAAHDLQTLCETVVTHTAATSLQEFVTERLPEPSGARVLGCILHLTDVEDGARSWWQYAAGAGDAAASYCLYLYHLSLGENDLAAWWREQTGLDTEPASQTVTLSCDAEPPKEFVFTFDSSTPTMLRLLGRLLTRAGRPRAEVFDAVLDYAPDAVTIGYLANPDIEIPLAMADFADHIRNILAAMSATHGPDKPQRRSGTSPKLPWRRQHARANPSMGRQPVRGPR